MNKTPGNIKNSTWNLASIIIYPVVFLALTPFFIDKLGEDDFGIWMLINSYVYIAVHIVSFGMGNSITVHIAEAIGKKSKSKLFVYVNISTKVISLISIATITIAAISFFIFWFGLNIFSERIDDILVIATILISVKFWELLFQSVLKGFERYDLASFYNIISKLLVLSAQFVIVFLGWSLLEIFISNIIFNLIMVFIQAIVAYRLIPEYRFKLENKRKEKDELFHFGFWTWLQTIIGVLAYQIDRFIVAIFLGPAVAGYYILASTIINHLHMAFGAVVGWIFPKVSRKKETDSNITGYFTTLRSFSVGFGLLVILITSILYPPIFNLWLGTDKFMKMNEYFKLFLVFESFLLLTIVPLFYFNGVKMLKFITSLELMYKSGVILGLLIGFAIYPSAESLIKGQIVALLILIPVEYYLINKKVLFTSWFNESIVTIIPSILISAIIFLSSWQSTLILTLVTVVVFKAYYLNRKRFNLRLLLE